MKNVFHWVIGLSITALALAGYWADPLPARRLDLLLQDVHFRWRGPVSPGADVVVAAIDEKSIDELGRWPWPRGVMAGLVEALQNYQARVVGFDVVFSSPDPSSGLESLKSLRDEARALGPNGAPILPLLDRHIDRADNDQRFAQILNRSPGAVLGFFFHFNRRGLEHVSDAERRAAFQSVQYAQFRGFIKSRPDIDLESIPFRSAYAVEANIPILAQSARNAGYIGFDVGPDGTVRKLPLIVKHFDKGSGRSSFFTPFSVRILERYLDGSLLFKVNPLGIEKVLLDAADPIEIPTGPSGEFFINFTGTRFPEFSIADIVNRRANLAPPDRFKDKIVLIGATAAALEDLRATPFDPVYPGVHLHATAVDNILRNNFLRRPDWLPLANSALLLVFGPLLTAVYSRVRPAAGPWVLTGLFAAQCAANHWLFACRHILSASVFPLLENILIFAGIMVYRFATEEKQKRLIKNVFGHYLSPTVVDQLMKNPGNLKLGGEEKRLTAYFTDLEGFTAVAEKLSPEELVRLLNSFLTEMTDILLKYEGTLDRYDGDAIKAFFGAPVYFGDHARRACWVCVEMQGRLAELRKTWKREDKPELYMRVGINTGPMVVGNLGSKKRMAYGMNGDSVNLAARLEGANKYYGTYSLIGESTYREAKDFIEARELDSVRVVGRDNPVKIYELLGKTGEMDPGVRKSLPFYNRGLELYKGRQWDEATACFTQAIEAHPGDRPAKVYLGRCSRFKDQPPPQDWDGAFNLESK
ncbi:MAG: CHASE2 domain-containing protein [Nitrospinae bacterium]|nr:CHASE2 domain-containing protein [Nitrospinota bacterium]